MGKVSGFLEYTRETTRAPSGSRARQRLVRSLQDPFPEDKIRTQGARCMDCGVPFCHTGCPVNNIIPDWNDLVWRGAGAKPFACCIRPTISRSSPDASVPALRSACVLGINEPPVAIKNIEKTIVDRAWEEGWIVPEPPSPRTGKRVAVVGSGPAGLAAAQQLARAGHAVTVFEKADRIGGLLRYGIPNFKMEKHLIDRRIEQMRPRAWSSWSTRISGGTSRRAICAAISMRSCWRAAPSIRAICRSRARSEGHPFRHGVSAAAEQGCEGDDVPDQILATGKRVVIIGGGDTGADCLGTSHRQKAAHGARSSRCMPKPPDDRAAADAVAAVADAIARGELA
jgi:glutamate synthase (NADPH/NADH) small chain